MKKRVEGKGNPLKNPVVTVVAVGKEIESTTDEPSLHPFFPLWDPLFDPVVTLFEPWQRRIRGREGDGGSEKAVGGVKQ